MPKIILKVEGFRCERCNHEWQPRKKAQMPRLCPKCKSAYWDVPRKQPKVVENA